jgi:hypothetical protein
VPPGDYTLTLKLGETELTQPVTVVPMPGITAAAADLAAQFDLLRRLHRQVDRTTTAVNRMRDLRAQLDGWAKRTKERDGQAEVATAAEALHDRILEIEKTLVVPDLRAGWNDNFNEGVRLLEKLTELAAAPALGDYRPTAAAEAVFAELSRQIDEQLAALDALLEQDVPAFNQQAAAATIGAVVVP